MHDVCCTNFTSEVVFIYTRTTLCTCHHECLTTTAEEEHNVAEHITVFLQYTYHRHTHRPSLFKFTGRPIDVYKRQQVHGKTSYYVTNHCKGMAKC